MVVHWMSWGVIATSGIVFCALFFVNASYGRYTTPAWGPCVPARLAWFLQEMPACIVPAYLAIFTAPAHFCSTVNAVLLGAFIIHYLQRTFVFSFLIRGGKPSSIVTVSLALFVCVYNGYLQGMSFLHVTKYPDSWSTDMRFSGGLALFFIGMAINLHSDHVLRNLRKPGDEGYRIPHGGMFEYVSAANYFGEILEWTGFAIASWSLPVTAFAVFTASNLVPRAISHHKWYKIKFEDYPKTRKAVIPMLL